jgi:3-methyl-2-oxobutanoate hydroxymethyltransferase
MQDKQKKITVRYFRQKKENSEKILALTAYDAPTAKFAEECGIELILVGDSLGMALLGYKSTIPVTIEQSLHHCAAVARGAKFAFIVGDMPFMTYHPSAKTAMVNAARYIQEAGVDGVKLEGGKSIAGTVGKLVKAGVPVMGHIGLLPQSVLTQGGYRIAGKTKDDEQRLVADAKALEDAGAFCVVLECIPAELSARITESLKIPTIGIGAGPKCDGQVQVVNDILGLFTDFIPKHTKRYANLSEEIKKAFTAYANEVRSGKFPGGENSF